MKKLDELLSRHRAPSPERMQAAIDRVGSQVGPDIPTIVVESGRSSWGRTRFAAAAVLALTAALGAAILWPRGPQRYATGDAGTQFTLADDSRVEMRAHSELAVDRADDGFRIRLLTGGIIVDAAEQRNGRLYVETTDVTVSVVGTVFAVDADETGSRVAVIEGEVRVLQGGSEKTLLPGQQVATNPLTPSPPVREAIAWSRNAPALVALLQQSAVAPSAIVPQSPPEPREAFEVASIRPTRFTAAGPRGAGGGGGAASPRPAGEPCGSSGMTSFIQFDPGRVAISDMTLYGLIAWAYELPCRPWSGSHLLAGGPGWVRSDGYDIQAVIPPGAPAYTTMPIAAGRTRQLFTPRFRAMLQTLLAERFGLVMRRETRDIPVYALTVAPGGPKLTAWKEGDPATPAEAMAQRARDGTLLAEETLSVIGMSAAEVNDLFIKNPREIEALVFRAYRDKGVRQLNTLMDVKASMASLAQIVDRTFDNTNWRPVLDRTNLTGQFSYVVHYDRNPAPDAVGPTIFTALERELGLRLTPTTAPMEVFVIERAEPPSAN